MNTSNLIKNLSNTRLVIVAKSEDKTSVNDPILIKSEHGYFKTRGFLNSHNCPIESVEAFLGFDPQLNEFPDGKVLKEPINIKVIEKEDGKKVFVGYIETPRKEELGVNFTIKTTRIFQEKTNQWCLGYDVQLSLKNFDNLSDFAKSIVTPPAEPEKPSRARRKKK